jgi:maltose alpha-D-glucosyltransferase/alpha-amylase
MTQTGRRVAEMHVALASRDDIPDFAPEPATAEDLARWLDQLMAQADLVFGELTQRRGNLEETDRAMADALLGLRYGLRDRLRALLPDNVDSMKIRHHGDFHLGQMLIAKDDIYIIDFEGEPRRSHAERRRKGLAVRDVAGLVRSIDYSAMAALDRALKTGPHDLDKLRAALDTWRNRATTAFLGAYHETMTDPRLWPTDAAATEGLLNFFLLEKAFYEIDYELAHRPDWLRVPLAGTLRILAPRQLEDTA